MTILQVTALAQGGLLASTGPAVNAPPIVVAVAGLLAGIGLIATGARMHRTKP
ncbi:hypothetical protein ACFS27_15905 [Promicromonospora vindobonensis]|uniref:LPXTG-motif cell wall-anchored protein n=1 Tax=Promicromonospora vindobonensis TaxID=195748 RepID=A0ABW5VTR6_9MICO